mmetsp:Transcript_98030/g.169876  ORF Transcript_98030/g.169876 Transcript_98030/m.169876 type:complete len:256 (-) Transcript_98030:59-826(-)
MTIQATTLAHVGGVHLLGGKALPTSYAIMKPTLPYIADEQLPRDAAEAQRLAATAQGIGEQIERLIGAMGEGNARDREIVRQLYEVVDRLRVSAKDAQSYMDRSLATSHLFLPMIESVYPCGGADVARNMAHGVHMWIGRTKDVIGNPAGTDADKLEGMDEAQKQAQRLTRGAADILQDMERKLGRITGSSPGRLHPMLQTSEDVALPPALTACLARAVELTPVCRAFSRCEEVPRSSHRSSLRHRRRSSIARFL